MAIDYEKLIVDALIDGVSKSSMLASSLAEDLHLACVQTDGNLVTVTLLLCSMH